MTIYSPSDTALLTIPFNTGCIRRRVLMKDDYITVKFSLAEPKHFGIGCYVSIPNEGRFEIIKEQKPTYNGTTGGYDYELTFCAEYLKWQNKIFFYSPENASREAAWSLTAPIDIHLGVFLRNLTANGFTYNGKAYSWTVDSTFDSAEAKFIQYNATNLIDALTAIADAWACEWWITDNVIHFGTCRVVSASKPPIEVSNGVNADISATESSAEYATRLYVFGSERNLPADYRKGDATLTVEGVVQRRLMLPEGTPYIDAKANMETSEIVEKVITIDSIYPKTNGKIAEVVPYVAKVTDENNNEVEQTFYRFKDASLTFSADYLLKDQTLGVIFTSGRLNGLQFDAVFNPNGVAEKLKDDSVNPDAQLFEIVANENYGLELPAGSMIPQAGDTYVLIGWDTTKIASLGLVAQAEAALLAEGRAQLTKMNVDPATYNCTIYADTAKAACATNSDGYIFPYGIGEPVMLKDNAYFSNGSRLSRIIGYEYPLDIPFDNPELIVGEAASYSRIGALESEVANIAMGGNTLSASGGSSNVYIIGTNDRTQPTNSNVYSALRTSKSFLSKTGDDHTTGKLSVDGGIVVNEGGRESARINNDGEIYAQDIYSNGDIMGDTLTFHRLLQAIGDIVHEHTDIYDMQYIPGFDGYGWGIKWDKSNVHAEFDTLTIRKALTVYELIIQKIRSVGGAIICSAANGKIKSVEINGDNYVITFEDECQFQADDLMRCQTFTGGTLKSYWVRITSATTESVTVAKSEFGGATPEAGDECVLMGNATNDKRQSAIYISAAEDGQPVIDILNGIKSASTAGCLRGRFGALDGINDSAFPADHQPQGYGLYSDNAYLKGEFILASTGENVSTLFEATNGKITAEITSVKGDINKVQDNVNKVWQDTESALNILDGDIQTNTTSINGLNQQIKDDYDKLNNGLSSLGESIDEISGNLTAAEDRLNGKIDAANDKIAEVDGKVDTADGKITEITTNYEVLSTRVEQTEANITLQAQSIKSVTTRVTQTESDITAANDRITETDKAVSNANEAIGDLDAKVDANQETITETITAMEARFNVRADKIESQVTKVSKSISSSGRNMLLNTNQGTTNWRYGDNSGVTNTRTATERGGYRVTRPSADRKATWERFDYALRPQLIIAGQKYTVSFKATNNTSETAKTQFNIYISNPNGTETLTDAVATEITTGTSEVLYSVTLKAKATGSSNGAQMLNIFPHGDCMNKWTDISIRDLQLERGEIATEYMPSNEDYVNETKETLSSSITQTAEEIRTEVNKQITDSETKITTAYTSAIKQTADNINLSVTSLESNVNAMQDEVDSAKSEVNAINSGLKTTGIDIKTGKVTISADEVTFTNSSGTKQALLTNGKLNAKALESESLTVQNAVNANQRIEVLPQTGKFGVNIYNGSNLVQSLTADTYNNGASDLFAEEIGALSISNPSGSASTGIATTTSSPVILLSPRMTSTPRTVFITGGTLSATAKCSIPATSSSGLQQTYQSSAAISLDLQHSSTSAFTSDVTTINLVATQARVSSVGVTSAQSQTSTVNAVNAMGVVPAGRYYRIVVSFVKSANGRPASTNSASVSWSGISAQNWSHEYISRHFANGIVLGSSLKDYFDVHYSNDTLSMRMETGGSGLLIQSKTDEYTNDMATLIGGYQAPMQRLICHGFVKYLPESGYKMHYHGLRINNSSAVSLKYPSGGTYRTMLAFSDDFKALLERLLGDDYTENNNAYNEHYCGLEKHLFCCINTRSATNVRAVTSLTTNGFITDALGAYEDFTFDIYYV